jgi:hypothetical protein
MLTLFVFDSMEAEVWKRRDEAERLEAVDNVEEDAEAFPKAPPTPSEDKRPPVCIMCAGYITGACSVRHGRLGRS